MSITRSKFSMSFVVFKYFLLLVTLIALLSVSFASKLNAFDYPKLLNRSLALDTTAPGATTTYKFSWKYPSNTTIGSVKFVLCADPYVLDSCSSTPPGDMSGANLTSQSGITGFSVSSQSANEIILSRPSSGASTVQSTYVFDNVVNPTSVTPKFFVQIFTYSSNDGSGTPNHISSVANAITNPIMINTEVPQILYFCVGLTIDEWCESANGNFIDYGALDPVNGHSATSQFGAATNALGGYVVTVNGKTMTSGNKSIAALDSPTTFLAGEPQFGLNLRANTLPALGSDVTGAGIGVVTSDYSYPDMYKYADGDTIAMAVTGSLFNIYTATYILNLPSDQPSGVYNTTLAYICTAAF